MGVIEVSVGVARIRVEGTPDAATLRLILQTLTTPTENA
jgi:transposase